MNVEIRAEAALFPVKEYINGTAVAVRKLEPKYLGKKYGANKKEFKIK